MDKKLLLSCCALAVSGVSARGQQPMNVLFLFTDDFQSTSIHALGKEDVSTPNIDYIYSQSTGFTNCYTNGAIGGALSMPSRAMLMTGRGVFDIIRDGQIIPESQITLPEILRGEGYRTFATGKWHSDYAAFNRSFSEGENIFFGGMHPYNTGGHTAPRLMHYAPDGNYREQEPFIGDKFSSEMYADAAVDFLKSTADDERPFFAYVSFTSPHDPHDQHPYYGTAYNPDTLKLPVNYRPEHPFDNGEMRIRDEMVIPAPRSQATIREQLANYYGMISEVDTQIGRVLEALREAGKLENTIIVFAGDNGLAMGQHGLMGKQSLYEHSIKVPLAIWTPQGAKGVLNDGYCYLYDVAPTLAELTGYRPAASMTGKSLATALADNGTGSSQRDRIWLAYNSIQRALVYNGLKYIIYNVEGKITEQLFDVVNDPWETVNLLDDPTKTVLRTAEEYRSLLQAQMREHNDFCDFDTYVPGTHPSWWEKNEKVSWDDGLKLYPR